LNPLEISNLSTEVIHNEKVLISIVFFFASQYHLGSVSLNAEEEILIFGGVIFTVEELD
jgi:hypothetical protein